MNVLITGPSGIGKTRYAIDLSKTTGLPLFHVDAISSEQNGEWKIDRTLWKGLTHDAIYEGTIHPDDRELFSDVTTVIIPRVPLHLFRRVSLLKIQDASSDVPYEWLVSWLRRSSFTDSQYNDLIKTEGTDVFPQAVIKDYEKQETPLHGWHQQSNKQGNDEQQ